MEKRNNVSYGKTPCRICEDGHSEYVCPRCKAAKIAAARDSEFDPEKLSEDHNER